MAMVFNKITKSWEDDGTGEGVAPAVPGVPAVPPPAGPAAIAPPPSMAGGGGSGESTLNVTVAQPPRPAWETQQGSRTVVESPQEQSAVTNLAVKGGELATAKETEAGVGVQEDEINAGLAGKERQLSQDEQVRLQQEEAQYQRDLQARGAQERELIEKAARSKVKAGRAKLDMWEGNALGGFISAIVRSVAAAEHARQGKDGLSPAERILIENANNFEAALVAKAEADKEMRDLYIADRPRWEAAMDHIRKFAADTNARNIKIAGLAAKEAIAKLAPEKRQAAAATAQAAEDKADAENEVKRTQGLRKTLDWQRTEREKEVGGSGDPAIGGVNPIIDPITGKIIGELPKERAVEGRNQRSGVAALNGLRGWSTKFQTFLEKNGPNLSKWSPEAKQELTTFATEGAGYLTKMNETGVLNQGEYDRYVAQMTPTGIIGLFSSTGASKRAIDQAVKGAERRAIGTVKTLKTDYSTPSDYRDDVGGTTVSTVSDADLQKAYTNAVKTNSPKKDAIAREISRRAKAKQGKNAKPMAQEEASP